MKEAEMLRSLDTGAKCLQSGTHTLRQILSLVLIMFAREKPR